MGLSTLQRRGKGGESIEGLLLKQSSLCIFLQNTAIQGVSKLQDVELLKHKRDLSSVLQTFYSTDGLQSLQKHKKTMQKKLHKIQNIP